MQESSDQSLIQRIEEDWQHKVADLEPVTAQEIEAHNYIHSPVHSPVGAFSKSLSTTWRTLPTRGQSPPPRSHHTMLVVRNTLCLMFGRNGDRVLGDVWLFNLETSEWHCPRIEGKSPAARYGHSAILFPNHAVVIFGGHDNVTYFNDVHVLNLAANPPCWAEMTTPGWRPLGRCGHAAIASNASEMVVYGGFDGRRYRRDLLALDLQRMTWSKRVAAVTPSPRAYASAAADTVECKLVMYGGRDTVSTKNDLAVLPCAKGNASQSWLSAPITGVTAPFRAGHAAVLIRDKLLLFGGYDNHVLHSAGFLIDGASTKCFDLQHQLPLPVAHHTMCLVGERLLSFGGCTQTGCLGVLYGISVEAALRLADVSSDCTSSAPSYLNLPNSPLTPQLAIRHPFTTNSPLPANLHTLSAATLSAGAAKPEQRVNVTLPSTPPREVSPRRSASPGSRPRIAVDVAQRFILFNLPDVTRELRVQAEGTKSEMDSEEQKS